jgi:rhodanese-related sulfurtransferase
MKDVSPREAYEIIESNAQTVYLDVRSVPEFESGHARGAINIPIMHMVPGIGMSPNEEFVSVVEASLQKETKIVVGCKTGMRSARATEILAQLGYTDVTNIRGGFVGLMDNMGRVTEPGWSMLDLPLCSECGSETSYESLAAKVK